MNQVTILDQIANLERQVETAKEEDLFSILLSIVKLKTKLEEYN